MPCCSLSRSWRSVKLKDQTAEVSDNAHKANKGNGNVHKGSSVHRDNVPRGKGKELQTLPRWLRGC